MICGPAWANYPVTGRLPPIVRWGSVDVWRLVFCSRRGSRLSTSAAATRHSSSFSRPHDTLLLLVAGVVFWIDVLDRPRPHAVKLNHSLAFDPDEVLHARLPIAIRPGWQCLGCLFVKLLAHADVERAGNDRYTLCLWVCVRRDAIAVRHFDPKHEWPFLARIAFEDGDLRPFWQRWRAILPHALVDGE